MTGQKPFLIIVVIIIIFILGLSLIPVLFRARTSSTSSGGSQAGGNGTTLYKSDNGAAWRFASRFQAGLISMIFNASHENQVWALDPRGSFYISIDGGASWKDLSDSLRDFPGAKDGPTIFIDPRTQYLYHGSRYGLLRSTNSGLAWE